MALKKTKSGSDLTFILILLITIAFLAPLYHSHNHTGDYHQGYSCDHVLLHDDSVHDSLPTGHQHNGSHLHIKKDIDRTDTHLRFKDSSLTPALFAVTEPHVFTEYLSCTLIKHTKALIFRNDSRDCLSGLSPPTV